MQFVINMNIKLTCIIHDCASVLPLCIDCVYLLVCLIAPGRRRRDCGVLFRFRRVCSVSDCRASRQALLTCYHNIVFHSGRWSMLPLLRCLCLDPINVYHAATYSFIPTSYHLDVCLPVSLASRSCMLMSVVASLSIFCFTCLVW